MLILQGNKMVEASTAELLSRVDAFKSVHIDIGTGDARNIYRLAVNNPDILYIGIDPAKDNMFEVSKKISKKPTKGGLSNVLLVVASVETLPDELTDIASSLSVLFPWGTLLEYIIRPSEEMISKMANVAKNGAGFEFLATYSDMYEEGEINKRGLPPIDIDYFISKNYVTALKNAGFCVKDIKEYDNEYVKQYNSLWAKRLAFGRKRSFFQIVGRIEKHTRSQ